MTDEIIDEEEVKRIEEEKEMNFLNELLIEAKHDWKMRLFAITQLIEYLMRKEPQLIEAIEKSDEPLENIVKNWATKMELDNFLHHEHKIARKTGEYEHAVVYANIMNYGLLRRDGMDYSQDNISKMELIGYEVLLTKALNCIKSAVEQLPDEVLD